MKAQGIISSLAFQTSAGKGLVPSITAAQAILETRNGESSLSRNYNNYFGITAGSSWKGPTVTLLDSEGIPVKFRVYNTPADSFKDRAAILKGLSRYSGLFRTQDPALEARELQQSGWATDPGYANKIMQVRSAYGLAYLDKIPVLITFGIVGLVYLMLKE